MDAIYYAINTHPLYLYFASRSIASVRRFDSTTPIYVHVFADPRTAMTELSGLLAHVIHHPPAMEDTPTFLKWLPLSHPVHARHDRLLFLDADTIAFSPVRVLLDRLADHDFYAREEGDLDLDRALWAQVKAGQDSRDVPVFNTGVMLFNRGSHRKVGAALDELIALKNKFIGLEIPYPYENWHVLEEVAASLVLGRMPDTTFGLMGPGDSPWFIELQRQIVRDPGVILHIWTALYPEYLEAYEGVQARETFSRTYGYG